VTLALVLIAAVPIGLLVLLVLAARNSKKAERKRRGRGA
jgi:hypothetical protein